MSAPTVEDLLALCAIPERKWRVFPDGAVRSEHRECPLCAMVNEVLGELGWYESFPLSLDQIGASKSVVMGAATDIACAADYPSHPLRPALLAALGIAEAA